jgi:hypothetical protein
MFVEEPDYAGVRNLKLIKLLIHHLHGVVFDVSRVILPRLDGDSGADGLIRLLLVRVTR